ncbi:hypothetical protein OQA88_2976 [Cercophora sp. LCS_1]
MAPFPYPELDRSTTSIRLLRFRDASRDNIQCELTTHNLPGAPPYTCLSYTWGDANGEHKRIQVSQTDFYVRPNLFEAPKMLPDKTQVGASGGGPAGLDADGWWDVTVDAYFSICINQEDLLERGHQVGMMRDIFPTAHLVVSWLGSCDADVSNATFHAMVHRSKDQPQDSPTLELQNRSFDAFWVLPYWRRMWIIQEFLLPARLVLAWGPHGIWWQALQTFLAGLEEYNPLVVAFPFGHEAFERSYARALCFAKGRRNSSNPKQSLQGLIMKFGYGACADPRDRVYALLGLVGEVDAAERLLPDYTTSVTQLYHRTLRHVRHAPDLVGRRQWDFFRVFLRSVLELPSDQMSDRSEMVYRISSHRQLSQPLLNPSPKNDGTLRQQIIAIINSKFPHCFNANDSYQQIYDNVIDEFSGFPREEDPEAWESFDDLVRQSLGLPLMRGGGEDDILETFPEHPGGRDLYVRYSW